jgi:predicted DNA-binding protein
MDAKSKRAIENPGIRRVLEDVGLLRQMSLSAELAERLDRAAAEKKTGSEQLLKEIVEQYLNRRHT